VDFDFNDEQKMLQKGARDFFDKGVPKIFGEENGGG